MTVSPDRSDILELTPSEKEQLGWSIAAGKTTLRVKGTVPNGHYWHCSLRVITEDVGAGITLLKF